MATPPKHQVELIDFWAEWCGPCKMMAPVIEEIEKEYDGKVKITKVNIDEDANFPLVQKHNVMSIPTYLFLKDGEVAKQVIGLQPKKSVTDELDALIAG